jgi:hypothetical protein
MRTAGTQQKTPPGGPGGVRGAANEVEARAIEVEDQVLSVRESSVGSQRASCAVYHNCLCAVNSLHQTLILSNYF